MKLVKDGKQKSELTAKQREEILAILKTRFAKNMSRHKGLDWAKVQARRFARMRKLLYLAFPDYRSSLIRWK